jgi:hypothetical protein
MLLFHRVSRRHLGPSPRCPHARLWAPGPHCDPRCAHVAGAADVHHRGTRVRHVPTAHLQLSCRLPPCRCNVPPPPPPLATLPRHALLSRPWLTLPALQCLPLPPRVQSGQRGCWVEQRGGGQVAFRGAPHRRMQSPGYSQRRAQGKAGRCGRRAAAAGAYHPGSATGEFLGTIAAS